jgi:subtilisin family serine protease
VLSTVPSTIPEYAGKNYGYMQGTSMACPHVSGVAALILSYAVEHGIYLTTERVYEILTSSVRNIDNELVGSKYIYWGSKTPMALEPFKGNMGTGRIDALMAIMNVRGAICAPAVVGQEYELKVSNFIGTGDIKVKAFKDFSISEETKNRLGIDKVEFFSTSLYFTCKKAGVGVVTVKYIAGGDAVGGGDTTGGKLMEKEIVIVARDNNDNGGWL